MCLHFMTMSLLRDNFQQNGSSYEIDKLGYVTTCTKTSEVRDARAEDRQSHAQIVNAARELYCRKERTANILHLTAMWRTAKSGATTTANHIAKGYITSKSSTGLENSTTDPCDGKRWALNSEMATYIQLETA